MLYNRNSDFCIIILSIWVKMTFDPRSNMKGLISSATSWVYLYYVVSGCMIITGCLMSCSSSFFCGPCAECCCCFTQLPITTRITTHLKWMGWTLVYKINNIGHNDLKLILHVTSVLRSNMTKNEARIFNSFILCHSYVDRWTDRQTDRQTDGRTPDMTHFISSVWAFSSKLS